MRQSNNLTMPSLDKNNDRINIYEDLSSSSEVASHTESNIDISDAESAGNGTDTESGINSDDDKSSLPSSLSEIKELQQLSNFDFVEEPQLSDQECNEELQAFLNTMKLRGSKPNPDREAATEEEFRLYCEVKDRGLLESIPSGLERSKMIVIMATAVAEATMSAKNID